jgi:hypothetical protein
VGICAVSINTVYARKGRYENERADQPFIDSIVCPKMTRSNTHSHTLYHQAGLFAVTQQMVSSPGLVAVRVDESI